MRNLALKICVIFLVLSTEVLSGIANADSFEPDDDYSNAGFIKTDGQAQFHSIDPAADEDWLIFTLEGRSDVVIETNGVSGDTVMWLYDGQLAELSYDDDSGAGSFSRIQISLPTGTYYVRIKDYNDKAIISEYFVSVLATPSEVLFLEPNSATQGDRLEVTITGQGTTFFQESSTITNVWLSKENMTIDANSFTGIDAITLQASFDIPVNALSGKWDVHVSNWVDGNLPSFADGFLIYAYPDLNGDGKVDAIDFALFAKHWLEVAVPNVTGMTLAEAEAAIVSAFLVVGTITHDYHATIPSGNVISSVPVAGTKVNAGSVVNLLVSIGPVYIVPNVTGMTLAEAEAAIVASGLLIGTLTEEYTYTVPTGNIISQNPSAGEEVPQGSSVNLLISAGMVVWVSINDSGAGMKDGAGNPISHGGFTGQMSKYETTNAQYCQFLNSALASGDIVVDVDNIVYGASGPYSGQNYYNLAGSGFTYNGATNGGAARISYSGGTFAVASGFENHPVTYVSWYGSTAFASYYGWRLPTEWEWQAVSDYNGSYNYGCGVSINNSIANYIDSTHPDGTTVVGSFGTYGYGMCDMAGNVWEWTSTVSSSSRVLRGGGWSHDGTHCTVSFRSSYDYPYIAYSYLGFRVCR